jgi:hypothetical protein
MFLRVNTVLNGIAELGIAGIALIRLHNIYAKYKEKQMFQIFCMISVHIYFVRSPSFTSFRSFVCSFVRSFVDALSLSLSRSDRCSTARTSTSARTRTKSTRRLRPMGGPLHSLHSTLCCSSCTLLMSRSRGDAAMPSTNWLSISTRARPCATKASQCEA